MRWKKDNFEQEFPAPQRLLEAIKRFISLAHGTVLRSALLRLETRYVSDFKRQTKPAMGANG